VNKLATFDKLLKRLEENEEYSRARKEFGALFDFINALINLRIEKGLTQRDLSEITGIAVPTISRIESGKQNLSFRTMQTLVSALGGELLIDPHGDRFIQLSSQAKKTLHRLSERLEVNETDLLEAALASYDKQIRSIAHTGADH
jgi:transcriptional regulator with XRE-family HTH domain